MELRESKTLINLAKAFAGECQAGARYQFLAEKAKNEKYCYLSKLIKEIAKNEMAHAKVYYDFITCDCKDCVSNIEITAGFPFKAGSVLEQLKLSAENEKFEATKIYPEFAQIAKNEGFAMISAQFDLIAKVESCHNKMLSELATKLNANELYSSDTKQLFKCSKCGHEALLKTAWENCPICGYQQGEVIINLSK